jgi:hypothetical protein
VKTDAEGNVDWSTTIGTAAIEEAYQVKQVEDGYIIAGRTGLSSSYDGYLIKLDDDGDKIWAKTYGGLGNQAFNSVDVTVGGYTAVGYKMVDGLKYTWILSLDEDGNLVKEATMDVESYGKYVLQVNDYSCVVAGNVVTSSGKNPFLMKVTSLPTIEQAIEDLANNIPHRGTRNSLTAKLENALKALEKGSMDAYENLLQAFINEVEAQSGKKIDPDYASTLMGWASAWINDPQLAR